MASHWFSSRASADTLAVGGKHIFVRKTHRPPTRNPFPLYQNSFLVQSYCSLRVSAVRWQSDHPAICLSSVCRLLLFTVDQVSSAVYRIWSTPGIAKRRALLRPVSFDHIVLFWLSASSLWSKPRVIICSMLQSLITLYISCVHSSSFEFLLHKYKTSIFWTSFEVTKTKQKVDTLHTHNK